MNQTKNIAVLGGSGRTGQFLISKLLEQRFQLKLLLRNPANFKPQPLVEIIKGDALDPAVIHQLVKDAQAVISTIGQRKNEPLVACTVTKNILNAMMHHNVRRYLCVGGINIDTPSDKKGIPTLAATDWMKANFPDIQEDRQKAYRALLESHADWTLVRVPMIEFIAAKNNVKVGLEDCSGTQITAGDIADFLVQQLTDTRFFRQAPFIAN